MINIAKGPEPQSLAQQRSWTRTDYDGYKDMITLRASIAAEQRGLCCYCMGRIRPDDGSMKIEHWQSHSGYPQQRLVYSNLLGACIGGEGQPNWNQHCDTFKANKDLSRNPANPAHDVEALIHYLPDGSVSASEPVFKDQLDSVLNLNLAVIKNNRKRVLKARKQMLEKRGSLSQNKWQKLLSEWTGASTSADLNPYCGVVTYWIRKKLKRYP